MAKRLVVSLECGGLAQLGRGFRGSLTKRCQATALQGDDLLLRDGNLLSQVNVLDCVEQFHAFTHRSLESFAS